MCESLNPAHGADPVFGKVFAVAVANAFIDAASLEIVVDFAEVIRSGNIVRVQQGIGIKIVLDIVILGHLFDETLERVSFCTLALVVSIIDVSAELFGDLPCFIGAVIGDDKDFNQFLRKSSARISRMRLPMTASSFQAATMKA